jgi:peptidoglycan/LPS O-acetylase OafA/YrhL
MRDESPGLGPALIFWLALVALPTAVLLGSAEDALPWTLGSLLYVGNFLVVAGVEGGGAYEHVWSLAVEEQFYLLWPVVLVALWSTRHRIAPLGRWLLAALALSLCVQVAAVAAFDGNYFLLTGHLVPLATGVAAAITFARWDRTQLDAAVSGRLIALGCLAAIVVLVCAYDVLLPLSATTLQVAASITTGYLILHVCTVAWSPSRRLLTMAPVLWLGRRSYGLYLYHRTLTGLIPELWPGIPLRIAGPVVLIVSFLLAEASFRLVESPIQQRGRLWLAARGEGARTGR